MDPAPVLICTEPYRPGEVLRRAESAGELDLENRALALETLVALLRQGDAWAKEQREILERVARVTIVLADAGCDGAIDAAGRMASLGVQGIVRRVGGLGHCG